MKQSFISRGVRLLKQGHQTILAVAFCVVVLGFGALSFAPTLAAHAASHTQTSSANRSAVAIPAINRCAKGYACIYPQDQGWAGGHPEGPPNGPFYKYGVYKIYNQYGWHYVFNNQTGVALLSLCTDVKGINCPWKIAAGKWAPEYLTPINSVKLTKY